MDLKLPITVVDEMTDWEVRATAELDLASGEISKVVYEDYDVQASGLPALRDDYEFTLGVLRHQGREVEFRVEVDAAGGKYGITPNELLELKGRAAKLFARPPGRSSLH
jgi:hypothetical protein